MHTKVPATAAAVDGATTPAGQPSAGHARQAPGALAAAAAARLTPPGHKVVLAIRVQAEEKVGSCAGACTDACSARTSLTEARLLHATRGPAAAAKSTRAYSASSRAVSSYSARPATKYRTRTYCSQAAAASAGRTAGEEFCGDLGRGLCRPASAPPL